MTDKLKNKIAVVTGASRGIGAAIAIRFAAEGAKVLIVARTLEGGGSLPGSLRETAERIKATGGQCHWIRADLANTDDRDRIIPEALTRFGGIDILVNNAAWARFGMAHQQKRHHRRLAFEINFFAPLELASQAIPVMSERGGGWIVNITSQTSVHPDAAPYDSQNRYFLFHRNSSPTLYGSTKAALERMSTGMAAELAAQNIAVNTLAPVEAVASEGALKTGTIDAVAHMEPVEAMAEAALELCYHPQATLSGRRVLSLPLLRERRVPIHGLDGRSILPEFASDRW